MTMPRAASTFEAAAHASLADTTRKGFTEATGTSVYLYFDTFGTLIYVGITDRGIKRNREHNASAEWWSLTARQEVEHHPSRAAALLREQILIMKYRPPFNKVHNPDHEAVKAAYLSWRQAGPDNADPREIMRATGKTLPLRVIDVGLDGGFALKAFPEHSPITWGLVDVEDTEVRCGSLIGTISECRLQGAFAFFWVKTKKSRIAPQELGSNAVAPVKFAAQKPLTFRLTCVEISRGVPSRRQLRLQHLRERSQAREIAADVLADLREAGF